MARQREFEGRNVAEAVDKACQALAVETKKIKYEVVSFGSTGIFGLVGARKAKIAVKEPEKALKPKPAAPPHEPEPHPQPVIAEVADEAQVATGPEAPAGPPDEETSPNGPKKA